MIRHRRGMRVGGTEDIAYYAHLEPQDGGGFLVSFPELDGCLTEGVSELDALYNAQEALSGWLYVMLKHGGTPPLPKKHRGRTFRLVRPDLDVVVPLIILWARKGLGLTQQDVASALGVSQQSYRKLEIPGKSNPTIRTLNRLGSILGLKVVLSACA